MTSRQPTSSPFQLDYCNSLYFYPPKTQINRLQYIQNSFARTVANTPKYSHITPVLESLHWLKIQQRIHYKLIYLTSKFSPPVNLPTCKISPLFKLTITLVPLVLLHLLVPSAASSLKITDRSFQYASPHLWNKLPVSLRKPVLPFNAYLSPSFRALCIFIYPLL